jgi:chromosome segregation ATPase
VTPPLPAEFYRVEATWHQAVTSFASRVHGEAQERVEHAIAQVKEEASAAADAMVAELDAVRANAAEFAEAVETSEARCAVAVESEARLQARVEELLEHQRTLQEGATDLRGALKAEQEAHSVDAGERHALRAKLLVMESSLAEAESTNRELREVVRTTQAETATLRSALTAGNEAIAALHRSVDQLVKTNATLLERPKTVAKKPVESRRTAKSTR